MAFFEGLVETEEGADVAVAYVGGQSYYVIDDQGFRRHIEASEVDRVVLAQFLAQIQEHRAEASQAMLQLLGQDDLFTKAMVDSTLTNISLDQVVSQSLPPEGREWLKLLGFRVIIDHHGQVLRVDMPAAAEGWDEE